MKRRKNDVRELKEIKGTIINVIALSFFNSHRLVFKMTCFEKLVVFIGHRKRRKKEKEKKIIEERKKILKSRHWKKNEKNYSHLGFSLLTILQKRKRKRGNEKKNVSSCTTQ